MTQKYKMHQNDGFTLLTDGDGMLFVPDFVNHERSDLEYCRAFMALARANFPNEGEK